MPVQLLLLARHPLGQALKLKSGLLTADHVPDAIVAVLEQTWGCVVYNHYGMTEMGLGGGVECKARQGYHLREADLLFEIIDPITGLPVAEGQPGEIVFTTLTRRGMPLVRYRTGDLSRFIAGGCPCGTALKTLEQVRQRLSGIVPISEKSRLIMADLDEALFPIPGLVDFTAQLRQGERAQLHIEALLLPGKGNGAASDVRKALDSIPAIVQAHQDGTLTTAVTARLWDAGVAPHLGKRTIMMA